MDDSLADQIVNPSYLHVKGTVIMNFFNDKITKVHFILKLKLELSQSLIDIFEDEIKVAKIVHHYTEFNLLYKNLKINQNPNFFLLQNFLSGHSPK